MIAVSDNDNAGLPHIGYINNINLVGIKVMELISSMLNIVKNVSDTDREFKLLREKLVFNIKKGDASLQKYKK